MVSSRQIRDHKEPTPLEISVTTATAIERTGTAICYDPTLITKPKIFAIRSISIHLAYHRRPRSVKVRLIYPQGGSTQV